MRCAKKLLTDLIYAIKASQKAVQCRDKKYRKPAETKGLGVGQAIKPRPQKEARSQGVIYLRFLMEDSVEEHDEEESESKSVSTLPSLLT